MVNYVSKFIIFCLVMLVFSSPAFAGDIYYLDDDSYETSSKNFGKTGDNWSAWRKCESFYEENSIIRTLTFWKHTARKVDTGRVSCRHLERDGTMEEGYYETSDYFFNMKSTGGKKKKAKVDLDTLTVGVKVRSCRGAMVDFKLLSMPADEIAALESTSDATGDYAVGKKRCFTAAGTPYKPDTDTLTCDPGYVLTGLKVNYDETLTGRNAKVRGFKAQCTSLHLTNRTAL
jgi:hypothetical protein